MAIKTESMIMAAVILLCIALIAEGNETVIFQQGSRNYRGTSDTSLAGNPKNRDEWTHNTGGWAMLTAGNRGIGNDASRDLRRTLIRFDISAFPRKSHIVSATLELYCPTFGSIRQYSHSSIGCYTVKRDWGEGIGQEAGAKKGEASWLCSRNPFRWEAPGCSGSSDRAKDPLSVTDVSAEKSWYAWDVTEAVRSWTSGNKNYGLLLRQIRETSRGFRIFSSSECKDPGLRPKLVITYGYGSKRKEHTLFKTTMDNREKMRWSMGKITSTDLGSERGPAIKGVLDEGRLRVRSKPNSERFTAGEGAEIRFRYFASGPGSSVKLLLCSKEGILEAVISNPVKNGWHTAELKWSSFRMMKGGRRPAKMNITLLNWYLMDATTQSSFYLKDIHITGPKEEKTVQTHIKEKDFF